MSNATIMWTPDGTRSTMSEAMGKTMSILAFILVQHRWRLQAGQVPKIKSAASVVGALDCQTTLYESASVLSRAGDLLGLAEQQTEELSGAHVALLGLGWRPG